MIKRLTFNKASLLENYVLVLLTFGLPLIAYIYIDWRAALTVFVLVQSVIGILAIKATTEKAETE